MLSEEENVFIKIQHFFNICLICLRSWKNEEWMK